MQDGFGVGRLQERGDLEGELRNVRVRRGLSVLPRPRTVSST
ncbi:hypothetical protein ACIOD0_24860 [Kitasatospora albolonga]